MLAGRPSLDPSRTSAIEIFLFSSVACLSRQGALHSSNSRRRKPDKNDDQRWRRDSYRRRRRRRGHSSVHRSSTEAAGGRSGKYTCPKEGSAVLLGHGPVWGAFLSRPNFSGVVHNINLIPGLIE